MNPTPALISLCLLLCAAIAVADTETGEDSPSVTISPDVAQLVSGIASAPRVASAVEHIEGQESRLIAELIELTEIPAPPFGEDERAARFA